MADDTMIVAGIDTGKMKLDVALSCGGKGLQVDNDSAGHQLLLQWLHQHGAVRAGIEASGGYEGPVVAALRAADRR